MKNKGFTLIELVIVIVLSGIIAMVATTLLSQGLTSYIASKHVTDADWQGRLGLERMLRDLRGIPSPNSISTANTTQLAYTDSSGNTVSYQLSNTTLQLNNQTLVSGVNSFSLSYFDKNGVTTASLNAVRYIKITMYITQANSSYTLVTAVYPRNLS